MWNDSITAINQYLRDETRGRMKPAALVWPRGHEHGQTYRHSLRRVGCFFPAVLALSGDLNRASPVAGVVF